MDDDWERLRIRCDATWPVDDGGGGRTTTPRWRAHLSPSEHADWLALVTRIGVPCWAAPNLCLEVDPREERLELGVAAAARLDALHPDALVIGSTGEDWPICSVRGGSFAVAVDVRASSSWRMAEDARAFAEALLAYAEFVDAVLERGEARGEPDAWRRGLFLVDDLRELEERLRALVGTEWADTYWAQHFDELERRRARS